MLFDSLAHYGLTPSVLQVGIVVAVILVIVGMYWHYILAGAAMLFTLFVFASGNQIDVDNFVNMNEFVASRPVETEKQRWHRQFMEDCRTVTENSKETCENIWNDRIMDQSHLEINPNADIQSAKYIKNGKVRYD
jgi:divalent metal cation (Fe/Co/Zn/Cd) transporter